LSQYPSSEAEGIKCDVSKEADVKKAVDRAVEKWGRLDVMVSRASRRCLVHLSRALRVGGIRSRGWI
jgi:NAD(P)-dependent dehydrogenase (short-subunit alcohol dehydrogenase family)